MLNQLDIQNYVLIKKCSIPLQGGLTVISGETGSGKSIFLDAIRMVFGEKGDKNLVGKNGPSSHITATFEIPLSEQKQISMELGVEDNPDEITSLQRTFLTSGKSSIRFMGQVCTLSQVKSTFQDLIHIHSQNETPALLKKEMHLHLLDTWTGEEAAQLNKELTGAWNELKKHEKELNALKKAESDRMQELDMLNFQIEELETANIQPGESAHLSQSIRIAQNAQMITEAENRIMDHLQNADFSILERTASVEKDLEYLASIDNKYQDISNQVQNIHAELTDLAHDIRSKKTDEFFAMESIEADITRIEMIKKICKKYHLQEEDVPTFLEHLKIKHEKLLGSSDEIKKLEEILPSLKEKTVDIANRLSKLRKSNAPGFEMALTAELKELMMPYAECKCEISQTELSKHGFDEITLLFTSNKGQIPKPIHLTASGGEMARIVLSLKILLADKAGQKILIFDEIDTGVSGKAAHSMALKLKALAKHAQVFVISHLPQIASVANHHIQVKKIVENHQSITTVNILNPEERVEEVARLLAGKNINDISRENARSLLKEQATVN